MAGSVPRPGGFALALVLASLLLMTGASHAPTSAASAEPAPLMVSSLSFSVFWPSPMALLNTGAPLIQLPGTNASTAPAATPTPPLSPEHALGIGGGSPESPPASENESEADTTPPRLDGKTPPHGATVNTDVPPLGFGYTDESGVDPATARISIDGTPLATTGAATGATARPHMPLAPGVHQVVATVRDTHGNEARVQWSFTVDIAPALVQADGSPALTPLPGASNLGVEIATIRFVDGPLRMPLVTPLASVAQVAGLRDIAAFDIRPDVSTMGDAVVEIHVAKSWLLAHDAPAERLVLRHEAPSGWEVLPLTLAADNASHVVVRALVTSFSPFSLAIDDTPPTLERKSSLDSSVAGEVLLLDLMASDASGLRAILVTLDGARVDALSATAHGYLVKLGPLDAGEHVITAMVTDIAGNTAQETYHITTASVPVPLPPSLPSATPDSAAPAEDSASPVTDTAPVRISPFVGVAVVLAVGGIGGLGLALLRKGRP